MSAGGGGAQSAAPSLHDTMDSLPGMFTAADRCDGCSARARYLVVLSTNKAIQLCGHHATKNKAALEQQGALLFDSETNISPD